MSLNVKSIVSDVLRVAVGVAAVLVVVLQLGTSLHVPASDVAYVSLLAGAVNAVIGVLKPYASTAVAKVTGKK
mgnify:CR=1 FL=1